MITPEERLAELGLTLPAPVKVPAGLDIPFVPVNIRGDRALFSGHPRHDQDGNINGPFGCLGDTMTAQEGYVAAQEIALCVLANLKAELGELSRIVGWGRVFGMVTSVSGNSEQHLVINGFSDTIIKIFGPDIGRHSRSAIGTAGLPLGFAIEIEGDVFIKP